MNTVAGAAGRRTLRSRQIVWAALLVAALSAALAAAFLHFQTNEIQARHLTDVEIQARVQEDHASAVMSGADTILRALAALLAPDAARPDIGEVNTSLRNSLSGRPYLRSLSLIDGQARVVASSNPDNLGRIVPSDWLAPEGTRLFPVVSGRDLDDLGRVPLPQARVLALPMASPVAGASAGLAVVALINPDHFATQFDRMLDGSAMRALLIALDGSLIVGSSGVSAVPGTSLRQVPAFALHLPRLESASGVGAGSDGQAAVSAFRVTRAWPLVVLVERRHERWPDELSAVARWTTAFLAATWALLGGVTWLARRSLMRDERLNRALLQAHAATKASDSRKLAILQSSLDAIVTVDGDGRVIEFNAAAERMFGHAAERAVGAPMHELIVPSHHRAAHQAGMARYRSTGVAHVLNRRIEIEALRADGSVFPVELTIVPVRTDAGEIFTATLRDITERRQLDEALRASRALLEETGRIAGVGGWEVDVASGEMTATDQSCHIHEIPVGTRGSTDQAMLFYAPEARPAIREAVACCIDTGEGFDLELPFITARGRRIMVRVVGAAERVDGRTVRLVGSLQDITERVQAAQELALARSRELMIGARIQQSLLVDLPDQRLPGLWLSTLSQASQGIDGDFVMLIPLGDRGVDIIVGDVMGKGVAAALMAAATKMQFSRCVAELLALPGGGAQLPTPAEVMAAVHHKMTPNLQGLEAFVTLSYLRLDTLAGTVTWIGCGHEEPLLLRAGGGVTPLANQHPPLGVLDETEFHQDVMPFGHGDALFLCSDGAADAVLPDGSRLGRDSVTELLVGLLSQLHTPAAALHALRREIADTGAAITDDLTLALALSSGPTERASRRELAADMDGLRHLRGLVENRCLKAGLDEESTGLFIVACVEAYTNAVRHTRARPAGAPIELVVRIEPAAVVVEIVTLGEPFQPAPIEAETDFSVFPEGGFGLSIMQQASDGVTHRHALGVNTVTLTRRRPLPGAVPGQRPPA